MGSVYTIGPAINPRNDPAPRLHRCNGKHPCQICQHTDWCEWREDGAAHCMRTESDRSCDRGGGWWHNLPGSGAHTSVRVTPISPAEIIPAPERADPDTLNRVYGMMLAAAGLYDAHAAYLASCGILDTSGYGSINGNRNVIANKLRREFDAPTLRRIPGLYDRGESFLRIAAPDGMLVAVRDQLGRISGMQIRIIQPDGSKEYRWLSSATHDGPGSGSPAHYAPAAISHRVWVTEGVKKADVCASLTGCATIGMPSHTTQAAALGMLAQLRDNGTDCVVIALDEDSAEHTRELVDLSRRKLIDACLALGLAVRVARWDGALGKGIDDLLFAEHKPTITVEARINPVDGPSTGLEADAQLGRDLTLILASNIPILERVAAMGLRVVQGADPLKPRKHLAAKIAHAAGMHAKSGAQVVGRALADTAARASSAVTRINNHDDLGHSHLSFAIDAGAFPSASEITAPSPRTAKRAARDKELRHCWSCGKTGLEVTCPHCHASRPIEAFEENPLDGPSSMDQQEDPTGRTVHPLVRSWTVHPLGSDDSALDPFRCACGNTAWKDNLCTSCGGKWVPLLDLPPASVAVADAAPVPPVKSAFAHMDELHGRWK